MERVNTWGTPRKKRGRGDKGEERGEAELGRAGRLSRGETVTEADPGEVTAGFGRAQPRLGTGLGTAGAAVRSLALPCRFRMVKVLKKKNTTKKKGGGACPV